MDDDEELVREVISENPPEDRGVRPEWESHQGWHRVENTHPNHHVEGKQGENLLADQDDDGENELHVAADKNAKDDDPLEPMNEGNSDANLNDPIADESIPGTEKILQGNRNELKKKVSPESLPRTVRGVNMGKRDIAYERATTIRKPLTIGLAAVAVFAYVTFQRRRLMKSTKDML